MTDIQTALQQFNPDDFREDLNNGEQQRNEMLEHFPLTRWTDLTLEEYALGQGRPNEDVYCWWLEYGTDHLGTIGGATAIKHMVYYSRKNESWKYLSAYPDESVAWQEVHADFMRLFELADTQQWNVMDEEGLFYRGSRTKLKTLHVYYPDYVLPIVSPQHMKRFLEKLGETPQSLKKLSPIKLNRMLLEKLRQFPTSNDLTTVELMRFLYDWQDPRKVEKKVIPPVIDEFDIDDDHFFFDIEETLVRKGQLILHGPPGTGKTYHALRFARWWLTQSEGGATEYDAEQLTMVTFHPSYSYEDFIEGFRPEATGEGLRLSLSDGLFKQVCQIAQKNSYKKYLIIIDEINRANLAKVFGEIITLLERDKRDSVVVTLPQSKESFSVPTNVYLLGTMNTSDRSIRLMDAALRRRFGFIEMLPDLELLRGAQVDDLDLFRFLERLNTRLNQKQGREKQIGHSFFLDDGKPLNDSDEFARRFRQEILPLLQEYCYDDYDELADYIGSELVDVENTTLKMDMLMDDEQLLDALKKLSEDSQ